MKVKDMSGPGGQHPWAISGPERGIRRRGGESKRTRPDEIGELAGARTQDPRLKRALLTVLHRVAWHCIILTIASVHAIVHC